MSWTSDTDSLLSDGGTVVVVKTFTSTYLSSSVIPTQASSTIETSTVLIFPERGRFKKEIEGRAIESDHLIFFPATSSVAVGHRIYEPGETDYHEVLHVGDYDGHKEIDSLKTENKQ